MPQYIRQQAIAGTFFFTLVTQQRIKALDKPVVLKALRESITAMRNRYPLKINAWVILPDHMHFIWTLPAQDSNYARRISVMKIGVSKRLGACLAASKTGQQRRERSIWQRRFWEHRMRDTRDMKRHLDYIHFNPVKHGLVERVGDWPHSSFHEYCQRGLYHPEWGGGSQQDMVVGE